MGPRIFCGYPWIFADTDRYGCHFRQSHGYGYDTDSESLTANLHDKLRRIALYRYIIIIMQIAECRLHYAVFSYSHCLLVSRQSPVVARYHSLANRHSCSTPAEMQDRQCFSMKLILVVGKVDMINQICQMLSFCWKLLSAYFVEKDD